MRILVLNNAVPFVWGGAEELAVNLVDNLNHAPGVEAELLRVPFHWLPKQRLLDEILLNRLFRLTNVDRVIALKFPAYLIPHEHKTIWLLHQFRQAYDLREAQQSYLGNDEISTTLIGAIRQADKEAFSGARKVYTNSSVTRDRLLKFNGIRSEILLPPLNDENLFVGGNYDEYIFAGGRIALGKRHSLLVEAMRYVKAPITLVIAGPPESDAYASELRALVARYELEDRISLKLGLLPRSEIAALVNNAFACAYLPFDEDSLGYVSMEAVAAHKAVLTTTDSGGVRQLVRHGDTGLVAEPNPQDIAQKIEQLVLNPAKTRQMGIAAGAEWAARGLNWPNTIDKLLSGSAH